MHRVLLRTHARPRIHKPLCDVSRSGAQRKDIVCWSDPGSARNGGEGGEVGKLPQSQSTHTTSVRW